MGNLLVDFIKGEKAQYLLNDQKNLETWTHNTVEPFEGIIQKHWCYKELYENYFNKVLYVCFTLLSCMNKILPGYWRV